MGNLRKKGGLSRLFFNGENNYLKNNCCHNLSAELPSADILRAHVAGERQNPLLSSSGMVRHKGTEQQSQPTALLEGRIVVCDPNLCGLMEATGLSNYSVETANCQFPNPPTPQSMGICICVGREHANYESFMFWKHN